MAMAYRIRLTARCGGPFLLMLLNYLLRSGAYALFRAGWIRAGSRLLEAALRRRPDDLAARRQQAWAFGRLGRPDDVVVECRRVLESWPHDAESHLGLGIALAKLDRHRDAIEAFRDAAEWDLQNPLIFQYLGDSLRATGQLQDALVAFRRVVNLRPDSSDARVDLSAALNALGHWQESMEQTRQAVESGSNRPEAWHNLAVALTETQKFDEAAVALRKLLTIEPDNRAAKRGLAEMLSRTGSRDEAIAMLDGLTNGRTSDAVSLSILSDLLIDAHRAGEALHTARTAVALEPTLALGHAMLGCALLTHGTQDDALECFEQALRLDPDPPEFRAGRGAALAALHRYAEAMVDFSAVASTHPDCLDDEVFKPYVDATRAELSEARDRS